MENSVYLPVKVVSICLIGQTLFRSLYSICTVFESYEADGCKLMYVGSMGCKVDFVEEGRWVSYIPLYQQNGGNF